MTRTSPIERSQLLVVQCIWGALTASLGVLVFVAQSVEGTVHDNPNEALASELRSLAPFVALALFALSFAIKNLKIGSRRTGQSQPSSSHIRVALYLPKMLIRCALHEAVALVGFVLATLSHSAEAMYPYVAAAFVANVLVFPTADRLRA